MASEIRIKRSGVTSAPSSLKSGELAYSWANGVEKLFLGRGDDGSGNATSIVIIGGQYFTDMLDQTAGVLTASSAIIVDANKKIDDLLVDNLELNGNTLSTTNTNGDLILNPNGTGLVSIANAYTLPRVDGSSGYVLTTNGAGVVSWSASSSILGVAADSGTSQEINLLSETLTISGSGAISTATSTNAITVSVATATTTTLGVASFSATDFNVTAGAVSLNTEAVQDIIGGMVSSNTESGISVTYDDTNGKLDFDVGDFTLTIAGDVDGSATVTNLGNTTVTVTLDTVNTDVGQYGSATAVPVITVNGKGLITAVSTASISTSFSVAAETGTTQTFNNGNTLTFAAGEGIDTSVAINSGNVTVTIAGEDATTTNKGIASFATTDFDVNSGAVSLKGTVVKSVTTDSGALTPSGNGFSVLGGEGINVTHSGTVITVDSELATAADVVGNANIGAAAFASATFDVTNGFVTVKSAGISNTQLANSSVTVGSTSISLGGTSTTLAGLTELTVDNLNFNGNEIGSTNTNGDISLNPNGTGNVTVNGAKITSVGTPTADTDAANKLYVDNAVAGLTWKDSVNLLAASNVPLTGTDLTIDGHPTLVDADDGYRILLKGQTTQSENGIYVATIDGSGNYTLTRSTDADTYQELIGVSVFVMEGSTYANTSWVQSNHYLTDFGHTGVYQSWVQFSGAGAYTAGDGLSQTGTTFAVNVAANGGIEIVADSLQLKSGVAGAGLTYTNGVLDVVGTTDKITVNANSIDIASTYAGQTSITTLGTIGTGTWQGSVIAVAYGGTGLSSVTARAVTYGNGSSALGVTGVSSIDGSFLREDSTGNPYWSNTIDGGTF